MQRYLISREFILSFASAFILDLPQVNHFCVANVLQRETNMSRDKQYYQDEKRKFVSPSGHYPASRGNFPRGRGKLTG